MLDACREDAAAVLEGRPPGFFNIRTSSKPKHYTITYVSFDRRRIQLLSIRPFPGGRIGLVPEGTFSTLNELVSDYVLKARPVDNHETILALDMEDMELLTAASTDQTAAPPPLPQKEKKGKGGLFGMRRAKRYSLGGGDDFHNEQMRENEIVASDVDEGMAALRALRSMSRSQGPEEATTPPPPLPARRKLDE